MKYESMTHRLSVVAAAIDNRTATADFLVYTVHPSRLGIEVAAKIFHFVETEILFQSFRRICQKAAATTLFSATVVHARCHAAVAHQQCHGISLSVAVVALCIFIAHVVPVVVIVGKRSRYGNVLVYKRVYLNALLTKAVNGGLVVVQHLRHGGSHAPRINTDGQHVVVWLKLIPLGGNQGGNVAWIFRRVRLGNVQRNIIALSLAERLVHRLQPPFQRLVSAVGVRRRRYAENVGHAVVGRHNGIGTALVAYKHEVVAFGNNLHAAYMTTGRHKSFARSLYGTHRYLLHILHRARLAHGVNTA